MALFGKREVDAQVTGLAWSRVVQMERQQWEPKRSTFRPSGETRNVEKHTEESWATVTDMTPGVPGADGIPGPAIPTMRQELRRRTYFTYEALEWRKGRTVTAGGADPSAVTWPDCTLEPGERIGSRQESYQVTLTAAGGKDYETSLPEQEWRILESGGGCRVTIGLFGGVKKVIPARR